MKGFGGIERFTEDTTPRIPLGNIKQYQYRPKNWKNDDWQSDAESDSSS